MTQEPQAEVQGSCLATVLVQKGWTTEDIVYYVGIGVPGDVIETRPQRHPVSAYRKLAL